MLRVLALAALVAACGPAPSGLAPADAYKAAWVAADSGEVHRALALLEEAADAGHLGALEALAVAHGRGYISRSASASDPAETVHLAIRSWPGQATRAERAYTDALADSARAGRSNALFAVARRLLNRSWDGDRWTDPTEADRDSALTLYRRLDASGAEPMRLFSLAHSLDDEAATRRHLRDADADGHPQACVFLYWMDGGRDLSTPEGLAVYLDQVHACPGPSGAGPTEAERTVRGLVDRAAAGNPAAAELLAGLQATGVFGRHPALAPLLDADA